MSSTALARKIVERTIGGKVISLETGFLAKQASGAVVVRIGDTMSLVATMAAPGREGLDFFPLTVDYREKTYAAGKFPGGFIKREGRPTTKEILTARLIDRPIRPLFPEWYREEVQIQAGPISADRQNDPDVPSIIGASASLLLTKAPFQGPIGAVRLARVDGKLIAFPTVEELENSDLDLVVASTSKAVVMIEGFGEELPEPEMADAIMQAHHLNQEVIQLQFDLLEAVGLPIPEHVETPPDPLRQVLFDRYAERLGEVKQIVLKQERNGATKDLLDQVIKDLIPEDGTPLSVPTAVGTESGESAVEIPVTPGRIRAAFTAVEERVVRELILEGKRPDGRGPRDLRSIRCEVSLLPAPTDRRYSSGARRRLWSLPCWAQPPTSSASMASWTNIARSSCSITTCPPSRSARFVPSADPAVARSVMVRSPRGLSPPSCPALQSSHTRSGSFPTFSSPTGPARWPRYAGPR